MILSALSGSASAEPLFKPAAAPLAKVAAGEHVLREAWVAVDWKTLFGSQAGRTDRPEDVARLLDLNLIPGARFQAERTRLNWLAPGRFTWVGRIGGDPVVIAVHDGALHGSVQADGRIFEIETPPGGPQRILERDQAQYDEPGDEGGCGTEEEAAAPPEAKPLPAGAPDPVIDVMVLYDSAVASRTADMQAYINSLIEMSNESYRISTIPQAIRLVHSRKVFSGVTGNHNSWMGRDTLVAALRNQYGADLVAMLIESGVSYCGVASGSYTTTKRSCAVGNKTFTHELGHNMGARHAWEQFTTHTGYAYGYINHAKSWRTVMSYAECNAGGRCTRILNFSNPDVNYNGDPTGIADSRDNARMMRSRSLALSQNRPTKVGNPVGIRIVEDAAGDALEAFAVGRAVPGEVGLRMLRNTEVTLALVDLSGGSRVVARATLGPGEHRLAWKATGLAPGVHFLRIEGGGSRRVRALTVF